MGEEKAQFLSQTAAKILGVLGVEAAAAVTAGEDETYAIVLEGRELGLLIGYHGEVLSSLQLILSLAFYRRFAVWPTLAVDAGGYRAEQEEKLNALAQRSVDKVRFLSRPVSLPPMPSYERRLIHLFAAKTSDIASVSEGEGRDRHVVLKLKENET